MADPSRVVLYERQCAVLRGLVGSGSAPARALARTQILLKADCGECGPGWSDAAIAGALYVHPATVQRVSRPSTALVAASQRARCSASVASWSART